jgi:hypothetical protein
MGIDMRGIGLDIPGFTTSNFRKSPNNSIMSGVRLAFEPDKSTVLSKAVIHCSPTFCAYTDVHIFNKLKSGLWLV